MEYNHCKTVEDVVSQVGELPKVVEDKIFENLSKSDEWQEEVACKVIEEELEHFKHPSYGCPSDNDIMYIIVGYRVKAWCLGLDEANTLHFLKLYNERRNKNEFMLDLFHDQEFTGDGIQWTKTPWCLVSKSNNAVECMYESEDNVTEWMWRFLVDDDIPRLSLSSLTGASSLDALIGKNNKVDLVKLMNKPGKRLDNLDALSKYLNKVLLEVEGIKENKIIRVEVHKPEVRADYRDWDLRVDIKIGPYKNPDPIKEFQNKFIKKAFENNGIKVNNDNYLDNGIFSDFDGIFSSFFINIK